MMIASFLSCGWRGRSEVTFVSCRLLLHLERTSPPHRSPFLQTLRIHVGAMIVGNRYLGGWGLSQVLALAPTPRLRLHDSD